MQGEQTVVACADCPYVFNTCLTGTACLHLGEDDYGQNIKEDLEDQVH